MLPLKSVGVSPLTLVEAEVGQFSITGIKIIPLHYVKIRRSLNMSCFKYWLFFLSGVLIENDRKLFLQCILWCCNHPFTCESDLNSVVVFLVCEPLQQAGQTSWIRAKIAKAKTLQTGSYKPYTHELIQKLYAAWNSELNNSKSLWSSFIWM